MSSRRENCAMSRELFSKIKDPRTPKLVVLTRFSVSVLSR